MPSVCSSMAVARTLFGVDAVSLFLREIVLGEGAGGAFVGAVRDAYGRRNFSYRMTLRQGWADGEIGAEAGSALEPEGALTDRAERTLLVALLKLCPGSQLADAMLRSRALAAGWC